MTKGTGSGRGGGGDFMRIPPKECSPAIHLPECVHSGIMIQV